MSTWKAGRTKPIVRKNAWQASRLRRKSLLGPKKAVPETADIGFELGKEWTLRMPREYLRKNRRKPECRFETGCISGKCGAVARKVFVVLAAGSLADPRVERTRGQTDAGKK